MGALTVLLSAKNMPVNQWSITLHGLDVVLSQFNSQTAHLVLATKKVR